MLSIEVQRGSYNEIISMPAGIKQQAEQLIKDVTNAAKTDEHGGWDFGIISSNARRGGIHTLNYDFYGVGYDYHDGGFLAVVQIREFYRKKASYYPQIRKSYFLIGTNEDQTCFAHPVESRVIHSAIKSGKEVIYQVQSWIFGVDYSKVVRQGDVCLIPVTRTPGEEIENEQVLEGSHHIVGKAIFKNGELYAIDPVITHLPGTHPNYNLKGKYKIVVGKRARFYSFAKPTLD